MKVIAVVGAGSDSGKTTLVCRILRALPGLAAVKISPREGEGAAVEEGPGADPRKDTARYAQAGAAKVMRITGPRARIREEWETVRGEFSAFRGVIVEGKGALGFREEKFTIYVWGGLCTLPDMKPQSLDDIPQADVFFRNTANDLPNHEESIVRIPHFADLPWLEADLLNATEGELFPLVGMIDRFLSS